MSTQTSMTHSIYSIHPAVAYAQAIIRNLPDKTGKSIENWIELINQSGVNGVEERRDWLKKEHKLGSTTAMLIAERSVGKTSEDTDSNEYLKIAEFYVKEMYAGPKSGLRPIHDKLIKLGQSLGNDVKICPCKTIVPFYHQNVFAQIKPTTRTRIDFGLALKKYQDSFSDRLIDTGGIAKGDRITHRIAISSIEDIDDDVKRWFKIAYDLDA